MNLWDSFKYYKKYNHSYDLISFPSTKKVVEMIHKANGIAILAHPGRVIKYKSLDEFEQILRKVVIQNNLNGIECYYPSHTKEVTNICLKVCHELNLMITCGSDCHGTFENTKIGELNVTKEMINLGD